jgi:hypothetical protein
LCAPAGSHRPQFAGEDIEIRFTGLKPGEKLYEELRYESEEYQPTDHPHVMRFAREDGIGGGGAAETGGGTSRAGILGKSTPIADSGRLQNMICNKWYRNEKRSFVIPAIVVV